MKAKELKFPESVYQKYEEILNKEEAAGIYDRRSRILAGENAPDTSKEDDEVYAELKKNAGAASQTLLCKKFTVNGGQPWIGMAVPFILRYSAIAAKKKDSAACEFIANFLGAFMLRMKDKYDRNFFYADLFTNEMQFWQEEDEEVLWRAIPEFAARKLIEHPELAGECLCFNMFKGYHWCALLSAQPQLSGLAEKYAGFRKLIYFHVEEEDGSWHEGYHEIINYWGNLLQAQPQFKDKCREYGGFDFCSQSPDPLPRESLECVARADFRRSQPEAGYDWRELEACYQRENGWVGLLKSTKEFDAEFEEFRGYRYFMEEDWEELLKARPELAKYKTEKCEVKVSYYFDFEDLCHADREHCEHDGWNETDMRAKPSKRLGKRGSKRGQSETDAEPAAPEEKLKLADACRKGKKDMDEARELHVEAMAEILKNRLKNE